MNKSAKFYLKKLSPKKTINDNIAEMSVDELKLLDGSIIDSLDWRDFSKFDDAQLEALGEIVDQKTNQLPSPFCFTIPPFVLGPLPQKNTPQNHFVRNFRWQEIHYTNTIGKPLPAGSPARILLLHIVTSVIQTRAPIVDLKETITDFIREFGMTPSYGEKGSVSKYEEALDALMHTVVEVRNRRVGENGEEYIEEMRFPIFKRDSLTLNSSGLISGKAQVDDEFARVVLESKVILDRNAVIELSKSRSPASLDIYIWATYTNFYLSKNPRPNLQLSWDDAFQLFSNQDTSKSAFKRDFKIKVDLVKKVYPKLRLIVSSEHLTLWQSPAHVPTIAASAQ